MAGPLFVLQAWAWDRFPFIVHSLPDIDVPYNAPLAGRWNQHRDTTQITMHVLVDIRCALDTSRHDDIIWEPYSPWILQNIPTYCLEGCHIWKALVPLICDHIVEWHPADKVMRQFGYRQQILHDPMNIEALHHVDLRSRQYIWADYHAEWIQMWRQREQHVVHGSSATGPVQYHSRYLDWYRTITRCWIGLPGVAIGTSISAYIFQNLFISFANKIFLNLLCSCFLFCNLALQ